MERVKFARETILDAVFFARFGKKVKASFQKKGHYLHLITRNIRLAVYTLYSKAFLPNAGNILSRQSSVFRPLRSSGPWRALDPSRPLAACRRASDRRSGPRGGRFWVRIFSRCARRVSLLPLSHVRGFGRGSPLLGRLSLGRPSRILYAWASLAAVAPPLFSPAACKIYPPSGAFLLACSSCVPLVFVLKNPIADFLDSGPPASFSPFSFAFFPRWLRRSPGPACSSASSSRLICRRAPAGSSRLAVSSPPRRSSSPLCSYLVPVYSCCVSPSRRDPYASRPLRRAPRCPVPSVSPLNRATSAHPLWLPCRPLSCSRRLLPRALAFLRARGGPLRQLPFLRLVSFAHCRLLPPRRCARARVLRPVSALAPRVVPLVSPAPIPFLLPPSLRTMAPPGPCSLLSLDPPSSSFVLSGPLPLSSLLSALAPLAPPPGSPRPLSSRRPPCFLLLPAGFLPLSAPRAPPPSSLVSLRLDGLDRPLSPPFLASRSRVLRLLRPPPAPSRLFGGWGSSFFARSSRVSARSRLAAPALGAPVVFSLLWAPRFAARRGVSSPLFWLLLRLLFRALAVSFLPRRASARASRRFTSLPAFSPGLFLLLFFYLPLFPWSVSVARRLRRPFLADFAGASVVRLRRSDSPSGRAFLPLSVGPASLASGGFSFAFPLPVLRFSFAFTFLPWLLLASPAVSLAFPASPSAPAGLLPRLICLRAMSSAAPVGWPAALVVGFAVPSGLAWSALLLWPFSPALSPPSGCPPHSICFCPALALSLSSASSFCAAPLCTRSRHALVPVRHGRRLQKGVFTGVSCLAVIVDSGGYKREDTHLPAQHRQQEMLFVAAVDQGLQASRSHDKGPGLEEMQHYEPFA
ncbi:hypothetical protein CKAN_02775300 [Cinnamomum micranthum f. kanehirae]|uniref:Uncharacterized protein n=1 Tax=Cinnamomum micranthum f. kanehirae TaxID=337451 RepID=A0A3S3PCM1_9MAGN|nr:hypothetical protein CKAN_02775300 [Cinnamomum micranthum f. kanehirae]